MQRWKKRLMYAGLVVAVFLLFLLVYAWPRIGTRPSTTDKERFAQSKNYDPSRGQFVNRRQKDYDKMKASFDFVAVSMTFSMCFRKYDFNNIRNAHVTCYNNR